MVLSRDPHRWTAKQVGAYLRSMNLAEEYVRVFESEGVNGMVLMTLTKEELEGAPFHMKGFVPVRTVLGCISSLKEQLREEGVRESSSDGATKETSSEMSDTPPPAVEQVPQRSFVYSYEPYTYDTTMYETYPTYAQEQYVVPSVPTTVPVAPSTPPVTLAPTRAEAPAAVAFPAMPPPPYFPRGFTPDVAKPPRRRGKGMGHAPPMHQVMQEQQPQSTELRLASPSGIDLSDFSELLYYTS
eukprot:TRINITY_DN5078_c1_g1_i4.p1 TRINITY_DN5078_c1_g1~~TRINITY_DN5078_c1_g1_i4.p1  ORF type:complete len:242 (+),score=70.92 TRINITY_DN5078_c1_g1_i4:99-824(+)